MSKGKQRKDYLKTDFKDSQDNRTPVKRSYKRRTVALESPQDRKAAALEAVRTTVGSLSKAAKKAGLSYSTVYTYIKEDKDFEEAYKSAIAQKRDFVEDALLKKIREGDTSAIIFAAKTLLLNQPERGYAPVERRVKAEHEGSIEHTHKIVGMIIQNTEPESEPNSNNQSDDGTD